MRFAALGRFVHRRHRWVLGAWAVVVVAGGVLGGAVFDSATTPQRLSPAAPSAVAQAGIDRWFPEGERVVAVVRGLPLGATGLVDSATRTLYEVRDIPGVVRVEDPWTSGTRRVSADGRGAVVSVELDPALGGEEALAVADRVGAALRRIEAPQVVVGGALLAEREFGDLAVRDAARGESVALVLLAAVLVVALGGVVAGLLPVAAALAAVAGALLLLAGSAALIGPTSEFAASVVTLLGIGLTVDYALLVLVRLREERVADPRAPVPELLARTSATAGRAVLVSGLGVAAALAGLLLLADPLLASMAAGGLAAVAVAVAAGLTLVPALIAVAPDRIPAPRARRRPAVSVQLARVAQRRPAAVSAAVTAGLLVLAAPLLALDLADSDARSLPAASGSRAVQEAVERDFAAGRPQPLLVLVEADAAGSAVREAVASLEPLPDVRDVEVDEQAGRDATLIEVVPEGPSGGEPARELVQRIRDLDLLVAGPAAELVDARATVTDRLPWGAAVVALATFLVLLGLTRSVMVPVKALALNALTLLATLGVLVLVFQFGWGSSLLGFEPWGSLDITTPLLLFMFVFGLSTDYEVFLLARIVEARRRLGRVSGAPAYCGPPGGHSIAPGSSPGAPLRTPPRARRSTPPGGSSQRRGPLRHDLDGDRAVLAGIAAAGPVVTLAAVAIGIVFAGFAVGELVAVKEIGVGMLVALVLDVTVVRGLLLPAAMSLLGERNWWAPEVLRRADAPERPDQE